MSGGGGSSVAPLSELFVETTQSQEAFRRIDELMKYGWEAQYCKALLLLGPTRSGKSLMVDRYVRRMKAERCPQRGDTPEAIVVEVPARCTLKSFASELLYALGHPDFDGGTLTIKTLRIIDSIRDNGIKLLVVDEVQRLIDVQTERVERDVSGWLTAFLNKRVCPLLLVGEERATTLFNSDYIRGRTMGQVQVKAYDWADDFQRKEFRTFLHQLDGSLGMAERAGLVEMTFAMAIHESTRGLLGLAAQLVTQARVLALREQRPKLTLDLFAQAFDMLRIGDNHALTNPFRTAMTYGDTADAQTATVLAATPRRRKAA